MMGRFWFGNNEHPIESTGDGMFRSSFQYNEITTSKSGPFGFVG